MKIIWLSLALLSFGVFAQCESNKHHVFLLHGIGGGKATFGSLEKVLNVNDLCIRARSFEYDTGSLKTPYEFAVDFHKYVMNLKATEIAPMDKISLVMHSQGGLVGTLWLRHMIIHQAELIPQMESFTTLSTPFWGADIAHLGKQIFYTLPNGVINPISPFGRNELNEMSFGSGAIQDYARNLDLILARIPNMRPLIISGMSKIIKESDIVVPTYSMRPQRYHLKDVLNVSEKPSTVTLKAFDETKALPFQIVPADHIRLQQTGVADIWSSCVQNTNCGHPSLKYLLDHLKGQKFEPKENYQLTKFRVTMYVNNPQSLVYDPGELTIKVHGMDGNTRVPLIERYTPGSGNAKFDKGLSFSFAGSTRNKGLHKVLVTVIYKNKDIKTYEVPVKAGVSSFIDADLVF